MYSRRVRPCAGRRERRRYTLQDHFQGKGTVPIPVKRCIADEGNHTWIECRLREDQSWEVLFGTPKGVWRHESRHPLIDDDRIFGRRDRRHLKAVEGSRPPSDSDWERIEQVFRSPFNKSLYASAPVRSKPRRTYDPSPSMRDPVGDYIPPYLARVHFEREKTWRRLKEALEDFGREAACSMKYRSGLWGRKEATPSSCGSGNTGASPRTAEEPDRRRLRDQPSTACRHRIFAQQRAADVPVAAAGDASPPECPGRPREPVLPHRRAEAPAGGRDPQRPSARPGAHGRRDGAAALKPADVSILYFEHGDLDVRIHSLRLDEQGNVRGAPPSYRAFFMEETRRSLGL